MNEAVDLDAAWARTQDVSQPSLGIPVLLQYWNALWRHRFLVAAILALAILGSVVLTGLATPQYTASTDVEISREQARVTNVDGLESDRAGQSQEFYSTQYELLRARSLAKRVTRKLGLSRAPGFFEAHGTTIEEDGSPTGATQAGVGASEIARREERAISLLQSHVNILPVRGSALVTIEYTSGDPTWSARIANAWAEEFIQGSLDRRFDSTAKAREFLEGRLRDLRGRLDSSERQLVDYAVRKNIITVKPGRTADDTKQTLTELDLTTLNQRLNEATADRIEAEAKVMALHTSKENQQTIDNIVLNQLRQRRAEVASQLAAMLVQFDPQYPPAQALQKQVDALDRSIASERQRVTNSVTAELDAAQRRERQLRDRVSSLVGSLVKQERNGIQFGILQREVDTNRQLYDGLLQRYKEIGVAGVGANNIAIVDPAIPPKAPSSPNLLVNLLLSIVLGIALAAGAVLILENLDQGLRDPSAVRKLLDLPLLGVIPEVDESEAREELADRKSAIAEAYTTVQSNLALSTDHGVPKRLMFTSTDKSEGKSTSAFALASGLARSGRKVLLVDADMRLPTLDRFLNRRGQAGLSNYLAGENELDQLIHETENKNLSALLSGPTPPSAPELLGSERMEKLAKELSARFDHVVFDSPPLLGLADALLLSRVTEGIVYVIEADRGSVRTISEAIQRLKRARGHLLGAVLTKYSAKRSGYGYGYSYSYRYDSEGRDDSGVSHADERSVRISAMD